MLIEIEAAATSKKTQSSKSKTPDSLWAAIVGAGILKIEAVISMRIQPFRAMHLRLMVLSIVCPMLSACASASPDTYQQALQHYERQEYSQALPLLHMLVASRDDRAMVLLAQMYRFGEGVGTDSSQARELVVKAAHLGNSQAQFLFAGYFLGGRGIKQDEAKAFEWNMKAASQGHKLAQLAIGQALLIGLGTEVNVCLARTWLSKASMQGDATAKHLLAETGRAGC